MRVRAYLGLGGISGLENRNTHSIGRLFDFLMALVAILLLAQWHLQLSGLLLPAHMQAINWIVFLFFLIKLALFLLLAKNRQRYLIYNWFSVFMIILNLPLLFSPFFATSFYQFIRPILAVIMFVPWVGLLKISLIDGRLTTTLISLIFVVLICGVLITGIDPGIKNVGDGIWWAWVTMSTVGFGDYVPVSIAGRILASFVILLGLCFFAILTANFSRIFIRRDVKLAEQRENREQKHIKEILSTLQEVNQRLIALEKRKGESDD